MAGLFYVHGNSSGITWIRSWESILNSLDSILEFLPDGSGKVFLSTSDTQIVQT